MTDNTTNTTKSTDEKSKPVCIHGWATFNPTTTIIKPTDVDVENITHDEKIQALKNTVKESGYDPNKFHIEVDYIEEKYTTQTTITDTTQYTVYGYCECGPSTTIEIDENKSVDDISDEKLWKALEEQLVEDGIDPDKLVVEVDEVLVASHTKS